MRVIGAAFGVLGLLIVVAIIGYLTVGVGGPAPSTQAPAGGDAPAGDRAPRPGYAGRLLDTGDHVKIQSQVAAVRSRVQLFEAEHGRYPASLDELVQLSLHPLPTLPSGVTWSYDPATGAVDAH